MPVIARFCGIVIRMLCLSAFGVRLHAFYGDAEMVVDLRDLRIVTAEVPPHVQELVLEWARRHQSELLDTRPRVAMGRPARPALAF